MNTGCTGRNYIGVVGGGGVNGSLVYDQQTHQLPSHNCACLREYLRYTTQYITSIYITMILVHLVDKMQLT